MVQGMTQGKDEANRENACRMKADGMGIELIAKYTGLSAEEIYHRTKLILSKRCP
jgi:hypothetical protein